MVFINEWLPNPTGPDTNGEFVELYNGGTMPVGIRGWTLVTESGKRFSFAGDNIPANGYLVVTHARTKLSLRTTDGGLALYDAHGALVDHGNFMGVAPEGKSFSRIGYGTADTGHFAFTTPTPASPNKKIDDAIAVRHYPTNVPLNHQLNTQGFFGIMMGTAALLLGIIIYVIKSHEDLSNVFFARDEAAGHEAREGSDAH